MYVCIICVCVCVYKILYYKCMRVVCVCVILYFKNYSKYNILYIYTHTYNTYIHL